MRGYYYRDVEGQKVNGSGYFEFEIRGDSALVVLLGHPALLTTGTIPTRIFSRFLRFLDPANVMFVDFDIWPRRLALIGVRWTETAGAYRYMSTTSLSSTGGRALGLENPRWKFTTMHPVAITHGAW